MQNIETRVEGSKLIIEIDLSAPTNPSKSGKTMIVASTGGNQTIDNTDGLVLGLNAYHYAGRH